MQTRSGWKSIYTCTGQPEENDGSVDYSNITIKSEPADFTLFTDIRYRKKVMHMILEGCQGKPQIQIMEKVCPQCGHEIEIFSIDTEAVCENCGYVIYNDTLTCVEWCKYSKKCFGEEAYNSLIKAAMRRKGII